jgi:hypothetical protein
VNVKVQFFIASEPEMGLTELRKSWENKKKFQSFFLRHKIGRIASKKIGRLPGTHGERF